MEGSPLTPDILFHLGPVPISRAVMTTWAIMAAMAALLVVAFRLRPPGLVAALEIVVMAIVDQLRQILLYHVVPGKVMAADVVNLNSATTTQGSDIEITADSELGEVALQGLGQGQEHEAPGLLPARPRDFFSGCHAENITTHALPTQGCSPGGGTNKPAAQGPGPTVAPTRRPVLPGDL